jgi:hypothetical protein
MAGPGLVPSVAPATIDGALKHTARAKAATASATIATGTSIQRARPLALTSSASFKKTPRPREARAARVGGKRRPECSRPCARLHAGDPATLGARCAMLLGAADATWEPLWVRFSRFLSMIFFHPTAEPVSRAHGCNHAHRPAARHVHIAYYKCRIFTRIIGGRYETPAGQTARGRLML